MLSSRTVPLGMDSQVFPSKTPGRLKGRAENALSGKGKQALRTPFHKTSKDTTGTQTQLKPVSLAARPAARPLGDKTPFPNRIGGHQFQTPAPQISKSLCLEPQTLLQPTKTPDALLRPSTARKHVRVPRSASKSFETPMNNGHHWDVSELSIVLPEAQVQETMPEEDDDEIEYMAPNTLDLPYQPPFDFDLPDYREVGKMLRQLAQSYPYDDTPPTEIFVQESEVTTEAWNMLVLPELVSDDPFYKPENPSVPVPSNTHGATGSKGVKAQAPIVPRKLVPLSRATSVIRGSQTIPSSTVIQTRKPTTTSRPGTSASVSVPASRGMTKPGAPPVNVRAPVARKPGASDRIGGKAPAQSSIRSVAAVPSRPATSTAMRTRMPSVSVKVGASVRRPTTSASSYKTIPSGGSSRNVVAPGAGKHLAARKAGPVTVPREDVDVLIRGILEIEDDFRFDV
ncbi:hypothetical protein Hypma_004049 [Hypsizygus marmoreus]|uniref:Uncharacterized protein n=1 Tax=Hypsizygus marmoreus TaxID=39966 RepID=A0A369J7A5_HYPMA|nr:hypothetical protein Hypma_004049 [Hypsizygus marmoreus]